MSSHEADIVVLSDLRFPGGTGTAIAEEIKAASRGGYTIGLIHIEAPNLNLPLPINPRIRALIDAGRCALLAPDRPTHARLAIIHNPYSVAQLPLGPIGLRAEQRLLVVQHPPFAADGTPYYDFRHAQFIAEEVLDGPVTWAPVGPRVRQQLQELDGAVPLLAFDWYNVLDTSAWSVSRNPPGRSARVLGRHGRADARKWPETREAILTVYPDDPRFEIRILGGGGFLKTIMGTYPRNWRVLRFNAVEPARFLRDLDVFVYYHHANWIEAFGCAIAEAMASGLPCILPEQFSELFGEAAIYAPPEQAAAAALAICDDPAGYRRQSETARFTVERRFGHETHLRRLRQLIGNPHTTQIPAPFQATAGVPAVRRVAFVSIDGVGMGHLARLLAIARRLPDSVQPIFVTMSQAIGIVHEFGYLVEYVPFHEHLRCDVATWNRFLAQQLNEILRFYDARVLVFDGNAPFQGVVDCAEQNPQVWSVWCRRGMWIRGTGAIFLEREKHFDAVLEPRDLAEAFDDGPTRKSRVRTRSVDPIRLLDDHELLPRDSARQELGLEPDGPTILVQLGSGNNFLYDVVHWRLLDRLFERRGVQVAVAEWLMAKRPLPSLDRFRLVKTFPLSRYFHAFDASVSAVGYNSYHDLIQARIPTLFVPNENPRQDNQLARARFAERHRFGLCVRTCDIYRLRPAVERLLDAVERQAMADACGRFACPNGAAEAARMIEELAFAMRTEAPPPQLAGPEAVERPSP